MYKVVPPIGNKQEFVLQAESSGAGYWLILEWYWRDMTSEKDECAPECLRLIFSTNT